MTQQVYSISGKTPFSRDLGLKDQIRRASVSTMANIAEGLECLTSRMKVRFPGYAKASAGEVRSHLYPALDQEYLSWEEFETMRDGSERISKQLYRLLQYLARAEQET